VSDEDLDLTLAWLALVPYEDLSMRQCEDATVLRYRVAEKRSPRRAESSWADRCGGAGKGGELGYRAAKADLIRGNTQAARTRLEALRARGSGYVVRAHYLFAVAELVEGRTESARDGFAAIMALPPARERTEGEDDARILAGLQLARVERNLGRYDAALAAYQSVPSLSSPRKDALLEGAVVAAHTGDLGAARNYLDALPRYAPDLARSIEMKRVRVQLAMLDDDEETALASFKELSALGRELKTTLLAGDVRARLRDDPSLGGLLDEREASRLVALGGEIERLGPLFATATREAEAARAKLEREGPSGPVKEALDDAREADLLLRRAEGLIGRAAQDGVRIAGPERAAMKTASRAWAVRRRVDAVIAAF
jgi:tetratricopeptide (TPR) repeat protein